VYACGFAAALSAATAALVRLAGGPPVLLVPTATELAALAYLTVAVTAAASLAWYAAAERLGVARIGLFNGLIPIASLATVATVGAGVVTSVQIVGALVVLAGLLIGLNGSADRARSFRPRRDAAGPVLSGTDSSTAATQQRRRAAKRQRPVQIPRPRARIPRAPTLSSDARHSR
jgi:hypothetical protein